MMDLTGIVFCDPDLIIPICPPRVDGKASASSRENSKGALVGKQGVLNPYVGDA
jgi:hypothetical protein